MNPEVIEKVRVSKPYIRRKGNKYLLEAKYGSQTVYLMTLPDSEVLIEKLTGMASQDFIADRVRKKLKAS